MPNDPLILTARFDPVSAERFGGLRRRHFPPRLNIVPAHLTLFHHLPGDRLDAVTTLLAGRCMDEAAMPFRAEGVRFLGRGVAVAIEAARLRALRSGLATAWADTLTAQDAQGFRPHVTVQNKADPGLARALFETMEDSFEPWEGRIEGLDLWHYRGGPWDAAASFAFSG